MMWRHLCLVRAWSAAGLLGGWMVLGGSIAAAQTQTPTPAPAAVGSEPSAPPVAVASATVDLLQASQSGELAVVARGRGPDRVHMTIRNPSPRRLNVIIPPGLVAASKVGQGPGGGGGGGRQSVGLGPPTDREGAFGEFQGHTGPPGLQSVPATGPARSPAVAVPAGATIELTLPGVCLNFGLPAPTPRDTFRLMDVDTYTTDPRIRKALRTLATLGTSHGVAQAVMWRVCNDVPFETMAQRATKVMNRQEIALAARFVDLLDESSPSEVIDPAVLVESCLFVQIQGEGGLAREARRLNGQLDGLRVLGLPLRVVETEAVPAPTAPSMALRVILTEARTGETRGRILVSSCVEPNAWVPMGKVAVRANSSIQVLDGAALSQAIDRALAGAFVTVKPTRRGVDSTTLKIENRLPFTVSQLTVRAGNSAGAPSVPFPRVGIGPARSARLPIQAETASRVEHVELNGL